MLKHKIKKTKFNIYTENSPRAIFSKELLKLTVWAYLFIYLISCHKGRYWRRYWFRNSYWRNSLNNLVLWQRVSAFIKMLRKASLPHIFVKSCKEVPFSLISLFNPPSLTAKFFSQSRLDRKEMRWERKITQMCGYFGSRTFGQIYLLIPWHTPAKKDFWWHYDQSAVEEEKKWCDQFLLHGTETHASFSSNRDVWLHPHSTIYLVY